MKTTRTRFIATVAGGLAAAALSPSALLGAEARAVPGGPDGRTLRALVGETFRFRGMDGRTFDLVLDAFREAPARPGLSQFSLTFGAPGGEAVREGIYAVEHPRTGTFPMFVAPAGRDEAGQPLSRADFNLLLEAASAPAPVKPHR